MIFVFSVVALCFNISDGTVHVDVFLQMSTIVRVTHNVNLQILVSVCISIRY
jgi:hypothetical protein